jgi:hypothetical protein
MHYYEPVMEAVEDPVDDIWSGFDTCTADCLMNEVTWQSCGSLREPADYCGYNDLDLRK